MTSKNISHILLIITALLLPGLACRAVMGNFSPVTETPQTSVPITIKPSLEPIVPPVSCSNLANQIIKIANTASQGSDTVDNSSRKNDNVTFLVTYTVSGDRISDPVYENVTSNLKSAQNDSVTQQKIWDYFTALIPADQRKIIVGYSVITDGKDNLLAAVSQTNDNPGLWDLDVDIADTNDIYNLTYTLIHEFGHILTLSPDQVSPSIDIFNNPDDNDIYTREVAACPNYFPTEGCATPNSYINVFYNKFWTNIHGEWQKINLELNDNIYYQRLDDFYNKYQDQFVNDYAPTGPEEDIAESWSFFVLGPKPNGATIAEEKILFFYNYPELVLLRKQIITNLCTSFPQ